MPSTLDRQFHGTCALVRVQLMRAAERSQVEECFPIVRERNLITAEDERLIRDCIALDENLFSGAAGLQGDSASDSAFAAGVDAADPAAVSELVSKETIARLHMIVSSRLNVADSA